MIPCEKCLVVSCCTKICRQKRNHDNYLRATKYSYTYYFRYNNSTNKIQKIYKKVLDNISKSNEYNSKIESRSIIPKIVT